MVIQPEKGESGIDSEYTKERVGRKIAEDSGVDAYILVTEDYSNLTDANITYLTEKKNLDYATIIGTKEEVTLFLSSFNYESTKNPAIPKKLGKFNEVLEDISKDNALKKIGLIYKNITHDAFESIKETFDDSIEFVDIGNYFGKYRVVKNEKELSDLKNALDITGKGFYAMKNFIKEGVSEKEVSAELEHAMKKEGADSQGFDTIIGGGVNSADLHHTPDDYKLKKGDAVLCDYGVYAGLITSDITRTFIIGEPDERTKEIYKTVLEANKKVIEMIKPGIKWIELNDLAKDYIKSKGFDKYTNDKGEEIDYFNHSIGHGLGIEAHDPLLMGRIQF